MNASLSEAPVQVEPASPLRVVLVTRRFWPLMSRGGRAAAHLAAGLAARGVDVTMLTARWNLRWPARIVCRGIPVVRLDPPPGRGRSAGRYTRSLARWLQKNRHRYDLLYVSMLRHEAYVALKSVPRGVPVVLRAETAGRLGDCYWQLEARDGRKIKQACMKADALVGPSRAIERELIAAGYPRDRIHYLPPGVPIPPDRNAQVKTAARAALADANSGFRLPDGAPLAVYVGRLDESKGLSDLVAAWGRVVASKPAARLWLIGDGPARHALEDQILKLDLLGRVFLAGVFDSIDEPLAVADLFVLPSREEGPSLALFEAMAAGLPIVATDVAGTREAVSDGRHARLAPAGSVDALSAALVRLLAERELAAQLGAAARLRAQTEFSLAQTVDSHLRLFENLTAAHPVRSRND